MTEITQQLKVVPGAFFQGLRSVIASAALMVRQQSSLIITPKWEYSSLPYRPRKSQLFIFRHS